MRFDVRFIVAAALAALLVPAAATAKEAELAGPAAIVGAGHFGGELKLAETEGQRPIRLVARGGRVGVLDVGGDLKIRCAGKARLQKQETEAGDVFVCAGRGAIAVSLLGSHVKLRGLSKRYRLVLPEGASGTWHGRFLVRGEDAAEERETERTVRPEPKRPEPAPARGRLGEPRLP
jgi:hypothetical protein